MKSPGALSWMMCSSLLGLALAGCQTDSAPPPPPGAPLVLVAAPPRPDHVDFLDLLPTETFRIGMEHFDRSEYGLAERYLRATVEKQPNNAAAWVALAASYDRIRRFDFADRAYARAIQLSGVTVQILNNQGFSYMLRGDFRTAQLKFNRALALDPSNPIVRDNIILLRDQEWANRHPNAF
jgi:Tfp pilus assembly protein PilF